MKRWLLQRELASLERYINTLRREGWTWFELQHMRHEAAALRVRIASIRPMDREDVIVVTASIVSVVVLAVVGVWQWLFN